MSCVSFAHLPPPLPTNKSKQVTNYLGQNHEERLACRLCLFARCDTFLGSVQQSTSVFSHSAATELHVFSESSPSIEVPFDHPRIFSTLQFLAMYVCSNQLG